MFVSRRGAGATAAFVIVVRSTAAAVTGLRLASGEAAIKEAPAVVGERDFREFKLMGDFSRHVSDILAVVNDIVLPRTPEELERYGFDGADCEPPSDAG